MLQQETLIERVRKLCLQDERVVAALMYGSFALGQGDRFSDSSSTCSSMRRR